MSGNNLRKSRNTRRATWRRVKRAIDAMPGDARGFGLREAGDGSALFAGMDHLTDDPRQALAIVAGLGA